MKYYKDTNQYRVIKHFKVEGKTWWWWEPITDKPCWKKGLADWNDTGWVRDSRYEVVEITKFEIMITHGAEAV